MDIYESIDEAVNAIEQCITDVKAEAHAITQKSGRESGHQLRHIFECADVSASLHNTYIKRIHAITPVGLRLYSWTTNSYNGYSYYIILNSWAL